MNHLGEAINQVDEQIKKLQAVRARLKRSMLEQTEIQGLELVGLENAEEIIIKKVAEFYRLTPHQLMFGGRSFRIAWARQVSIYLIYQLLGKIKIDIARTFQQNHGTINYAIKTVLNQIEVDSKIAKEIKSIQGAIREIGREE